MSKSYSKTRVLVECALMVAIGTVLANIKIFTMPNGGSVTLLSMLPFVLVSFRHGVKWGLFTGLVNGCLQMLPWQINKTLIIIFHILLTPFNT